MCIRQYYRVTFFFFFFNDTATPEIYTLSLHDALPICRAPVSRPGRRGTRSPAGTRSGPGRRRRRCPDRSEEHTSELQSRREIVCRLLLEKKKQQSADRVCHHQNHLSYPRHNG